MAKMTQAQVAKYLLSLRDASDNFEGFVRLMQGGLGWGIGTQLGVACCMLDIFNEKLRLQLHALKLPFEEHAAGKMRRP